MTPEFYFDESCPVCRSYVKQLKKKLSEDQLRFMPIKKAEQPNYSDFVLKESHQESSGKAAVNRLVELYPEIKDLFWILPEQYREDAVYAASGLGKWLRKFFNRFKSCDCD